MASDHEMAFLDGRVPELARLFIKHGIDINRVWDLPEEFAVSPLWSMAFWCTPNAMKTLSILLDSGLKAPALDQFISHFVEDAAYVSGDIKSDHYQDYLICGLKMIMLAASYDEALNSSDHLKELIGLSTYNKGNDYDLNKFRNYDDFDYELDKSTCTNIKYVLANATIIIKEKETGKEAWRFFL